MYYTQHPTAWRVVVMRNPPLACATQDFDTRAKAEKGAEHFMGSGVPVAVVSIHDNIRTIFVDQR